MLLGSHLAGLSLAGVTMGLHHGLCHVLGGTANVPHGIANSIILPHAMRFNADATALQLLPAAEAMGISVNGLSPAAAVEVAAAQTIFDLIGPDEPAAASARCRRARKRPAAPRPTCLSEPHRAKQPQADYRCEPD